MQDRLKDTVSAAAKDANAAATPAAKDLGDVRRFLNRLLGLPLGRQNLLFNYFTATLAAEIAAARAEGRYGTDSFKFSSWLMLVRLCVLHARVACSSVDRRFNSTSACCFL